ncbi:MAG: hypothetical protein F9K26_07680 [Ignavibacteriaceae bacterium]|nr:MAG: hypothetical protein F9K26_07680 [Ignavibacteriaceae bacterium]MBW7874265.1 hypothetical protein [Ignavibacteria bacterium]OQY70661.1 MAG: hypothetical protein B6D45_10880 [Ignavibacteriales bacterium UTCHB3]WKZ72439.1 MAG: hypothetical protein QY308_12515 [Ignavibacteriaceae bacterium]
MTSRNFIGVLGLLGSIVIGGSTSYFLAAITKADATFYSRIFVLLIPAFFAGWLIGEGFSRRVSFWLALLGVLFGVSGSLANELFFGESYTTSTGAFMYLSKALFTGLIVSSFILFGRNSSVLRFASGFGELEDDASATEKADLAVDGFDRSAEKDADLAVDGFDRSAEKDADLAVDGFDRSAEKDADLADKSGRSADSGEEPSHSDEKLAVSEERVASFEGGVATSERNVATFEGGVATSERNVATFEGGVATFDESAATSDESAATSDEREEIIPEEDTISRLFHPFGVHYTSAEEAVKTDSFDGTDEENKEISEKDTIFGATLFEKNAELIVQKARLEADRILFAAEQDLQRIRGEKEKTENELKLLVKTERELIKQYKEKV